MSLAVSSVAPSLPPRLRTLGAADLPLRVEPLAVLTCREGDLAARVAGESLRVRAGELLVLRRAGPLELERADAGAQVAVFLASPAWVDAYWELHGVRPKDGAELELLPAAAALSRRATKLLATLAEAGAGEPLSAGTVATLLEIACQAEGSPLGSRRSRQQLAGQRRAVVRALADYDPEADGDFSLYGLAERLGLSPRQTARLVRGETGRSFRELKAAARIERARKLLAASDLSILEVALRSGWNSASQFHDAFRRSVGLTPSRYRMAHRR
jgi:AraC-like DNA-binding protein